MNFYFDHEQEEYLMHDDWREDTRSRLNNCELYKHLVEKCKDDSSGEHVLALVNDVAYYSVQRTKTIMRHMGEYTLHDGDHLFRVVTLMGLLLNSKNISELSVPELMLLLLSAFLHDIGMAPDENIVMAWKKVWDLDPLFDEKSEEEEHRKFKRFLAARPDKSALVEDLINRGEYAKSDLIKGYLISDYIRETHSQRSREIVYRDWSEKIKYKDTDLTSELAEICFSHNEDALSLLDQDKQFLCGQGIYVCLPMVSVFLRLADVLDFDAKRTPEILFSHLSVKNPISINEWNKHRSIEAWNISSELIQYHAKCTHPAIEASIHKFCNIIDSELSVCNNIITSVNQFHMSINRDLTLIVPLKVDRSKITTKKDIFGKPMYLYRDSQFTLSKNQVVDLLMGTKLYGDPEVALRELIQNSIDACLLRKSLENEWGNIYEPELKVRYFKDNEEDILEVIDNGTGMDQYIIDTYYSKVGSSFYKSADFYDLKSQSNSDFIPTSRFGIGLLACFMVSDCLIVDTRRVYGPHDSSEPVNLTIEGQESIFWIKQGARKVPGTTTKLILRKDKNPWGHMSKGQFIKSVESVIPNPPFKVILETDDEVKNLDESSFRINKLALLEKNTWQKHKNVREIKIPLDDTGEGVVGFAIAYVLESHKRPVMKLDLAPKYVDIENEKYKLSKSIEITNNEIKLRSTSITINEEGEIEEFNSSSTIARSESKLSLHGIEIPTSLFIESWRVQKNQVRIDWPFPINLVIDVSGKNDLDLNSSRTQIVQSDKWFIFEEKLAFIICEKIASSVGWKYWGELKKVLLTSTKNEFFINGLNRVVIPPQYAHLLDD